MSSLLPPNTTALERNLESIIGSSLSSVEMPLVESWSPDNCPADLIPWLAWARSVDYWDTSWTEDQKRQVVADAYYNHSIKGTIGSLKNAVSVFGFDIDIQEWFNQIPTGQAYTFQVNVNIDQVGASQSDLNLMIKLIETYKNLRSHMTAILPSITSSALGYHASFAASGGEVVLTATPAGGILINNETIILSE